MLKAIQIETTNERKCSDCHKMLAQKGKDKWQPPCWTEYCHTAKYQYAGVRTWIEFLYLVLHASNLSQGLVVRLLEDAEVRDSETLELIIIASNHLRAGLREKDRRDRESS